MTTSAMIVGFVLALASGTNVEEPLENPEYANWSKFKPGTLVVNKSTATSVLGTTERKLTMTLVSVTKHRAVVEETSLIKVGGVETKLPPERHDVLRTLPPGVKKEELGKPEGTLEEGTETLKIAGKTFRTRWYRARTTAAGFDREVKIWYSADVPGLLVKEEVTVKDGGKAVATDRTEVRLP